MGRRNRPGEHEGRAVVARADERWTAQLELDERSEEQLTRVRVDLPGTFLSEAAATRAAERVLNEWRGGRVGVRDLVLRELAAVYRHLRERHQSMEPVAVPTTSAAWERAIALWELAGWLDAAAAGRYREHARHAFDAMVVTIKRHRLTDVEPESAQ